MNTTRDIQTLREFYDLMAGTRDTRFRITTDLIEGRSVSDQDIRDLEAALASLTAISDDSYRATLILTRSRESDLDLKYEITELQKDLVLLTQGESHFLEYLGSVHDDFEQEVTVCREFLQRIEFDSFITDRDGTTNNYCGRYRSSVQSAWNGLFLTRFAQLKTRFPIIVTSGPLKDIGVLDVSVNPEGSFIYAASKGRECLDLSGQLHRLEIPQDKQAALDELNRRLSQLVSEQNYEKFSLIGSGLQFKFGQSTIARQDISGSIPEKESEDFLQTIREIVHDLDPAGDNFRIEDTGLDVEIILTIEDERAGLKDFDKGDAVRYLNKVLNLHLEDGIHLVCGDTFSDVPMVEAAVELNPGTRAIFVTRDNRLAQKVREVCVNSLVVREPDILVTSLWSTAVRG